MTIQDEIRRRSTSGLGPRKGRHGGYIGRDDDRERGNSRANEPGRARSAEEKARNVAAFERAAAQDRERRVNALEAALSRSPHGRRTLELMAQAARERLCEQLAGELVRGTTETLARLRRGLDRRDRLKQERAAMQIPAAEEELRKWRRALLDYELRRELTEAAIRDMARLLA